VFFPGRFVGGRRGVQGKKKKRKKTEKPYARVQGALILLPVRGEEKAE